MCVCVCISASVFSLEKVTLAEHSYAALGKNTSERERESLREGEICVEELYVDIFYIF